MKRGFAKLSLSLSVVVLVGALIGPTVRDHIWPDPNASDEPCPFTRGKTAEEIAAAGPSPHGADEEERARLHAARDGAKHADHDAREAALLALLAHDPAHRLFTASELLNYDGSDPELPLLLAIGGHVVDVSASSWMYGSTAPRAIYAGRAVTRALVLQSTKPDDVARADDADDFTAEQNATRLQRVIFYIEKFPKLGELESAAVIRGGGGGGAH